MPVAVSLFHTLVKCPLCPLFTVESSMVTESHLLTEQSLLTEHPVASKLQVLAHHWTMTSV